MVKKSPYFKYQSKVKEAYGKLKRAYKEAKDSYVEMIFRFALVAEYKDEVTGTHLVRIADYCTEIAKELGLSMKDIDYIRYASPMKEEPI